eukprot:scaffold56623_cov36-Prasinocladus_malaysianus.AAC.2
MHEGILAHCPKVRPARIAPAFEALQAPFHHIHDKGPPGPRDLQPELGQHVSDRVIVGFIPRELPLLRRQLVQVEACIARGEQALAVESDADVVGFRRAPAEKLLAEVKSNVAKAPRVLPCRRLRRMIQVLERQQTILPSQPNKRAHDDKFHIKMAGS